MNTMNGLPKKVISLSITHFTRVVFPSGVKVKEASDSPIHSMLRCEAIREFPMLSVSS